MNYLLVQTPHRGGMSAGYVAPVCWWRSSSDSNCKSHAPSDLWVQRSSFLLMRNILDHFHGRFQMHPRLLICHHLNHSVSLQRLEAESNNDSNNVSETAQLPTAQLVEYQTTVWFSRKGRSTCSTATRQFSFSWETQLWQQLANNCADQKNGTDSPHKNSIKLIILTPSSIMKAKGFTLQHYRSF